MRLAILDDYQNVALDLADWGRLKGKVEITTFTEPFSGSEATIAALQPFDAVLLMRERTPFPAAVIEQLPKLELIVTTGLRNLAIDVGAAVKRGITVSGTQTSPEPVVELAWAMILGIAHNIAAEDRSMRAGGWQIGLGQTLAGKVLGIVGLGKLGRRVGEIGRAFGMEIIAWSQNLTPEKAAEAGARHVSKEELFRSADVVTLHLVLSARTRGLVGAAELALMKPSAYLINTSRGPLVDETALIDALRNHRIAGAALDVYDVEPLPVDHPLRKLDNTLLGPHIGYVTAENYAGMYAQAVEDIEAYLAGKPLRLLTA